MSGQSNIMHEKNGHGAGQQGLLFSSDPELIGARDRYP